MWSVPRTWKNETCFILAGGPSLLGFDARVLRGKGRVITINDSWRLAPWADVCYFCDDQWWHQQIAKNPRSLDGTRTFYDSIYKNFWICGGSGHFKGHPQVHQLLFTGPTGLETNPTGLRHGSNSSYQAINLAYHFGVDQIVLLGVDMRVSSDGRTHWHDEPRESAFQLILANTMLPKFIALVEPLQEAGVEVLNASPVSALTCWPMASLSSILGSKLEPWQSSFNFA